MSFTSILSVPTEIRLTIYKYYLNSIIRIHATDGVPSTDCRQLDFYDARTHLALLRVSRIISSEAICALYQHRHFQVADCMCWEKGRVPVTARYRIRHLISPPSASGRAYTRLQKMLQALEKPECRRLEEYVYAPKALTYLTIFEVSECTEMDHLNNLLNLTRDRIKELHCWVKDDVWIHLCYARVDSKLNMTLYNIGKKKLSNLRSQLIQNCRQLQSVTVQIPDSDWVLQNLDRTTPQVDLFITKL